MTKLVGVSVLLAASAVATAQGAFIGSQSSMISPEQMKTFEQKYNLQFDTFPQYFTE